MDFYVDLINFLNMLGGALAEAGKEIITFLQTPIEQFDGSPLWQVVTGFFLVLIVPYTLIKWFIPI